MSPVILKLNNGSYITGNSEILPFVLNTEQPQSDARLLEISAKTLSKKKFVKANRSHNNKVQRNCDVMC